MLARAWGAVLDGVDAVPVRVEVDINSGLPAFTVVGLPDVKQWCRSFRSFWR
jgi:hypothetical protein